MPEESPGVEVKKKRFKIPQVLLYRAGKILSGRGVFMFLSIIALTYSAFLVWDVVVQPLRIDAGLPAGVSSAIPAVDSSAARIIAEKRSQRVQTVPRSFSRFNSVFTSQVQ